MTWVLDAEAFSVVAKPSTRPEPSRTLGLLQVALADNDEILVPGVVLAELYRGRQHDQVVDACLSRFPAIVVVDTDRRLAREVGHVLARAGRGPADHVDASVVAAAARNQPSVIATGDLGDLTALAEGATGVSVLQV